MDLKSFIKEGAGDGGSAFRPISKNISALVIQDPKSFSVFKSQKKLKEFSSKVSEVAYSDEVIDELSQNVGEPQEDETEDQFVERAKSEMKKILKKKLF